MSFIRANFSDANKRAGNSFLPPHHYDCKRGNIYGDSCTDTVGLLTRAPLGHHQQHANTLLCPLVERCCYPCESTIVEMPVQFIQYIRAEHMAADHKTDDTKFLTRNKQDLLRNAVKVVPI